MIWSNVDWRVMRQEYVRGFEEALELVLARMKGLKNVDECRRMVEYLLSLVKERKIREVEVELNVLR